MDLNKAIHKEYDKALKRKCDFRISYRFYDESEGGRKQLPHQGIRSDFWYEHENHNKTKKGNWLFMIWPEFENEDCNVIESGEVLKSGTARMWIINDELRSYHKSCIEIGTIGWFREGSHSTGICEVIEIVDLNNI